MFAFQFLSLAVTTKPVMAGRRTPAKSALLLLLFGLRSFAAPQAAGTMTTVYTTGTETFTAVLASNSVIVQDALSTAIVEDGDETTFKGLTISANTYGSVIIGPSSAVVASPSSLGVFSNSSVPVVGISSSSSVPVVGPSSSSSVPVVGLSSNSSIPVLGMHLQTHLPQIPG